MRTVLAVLCYGVAMVFGVLAFALAYIGASFQDLGDMTNPMVNNGD